MNWQDRKDISLAVLREKNATFVGGENGVFASYAEGSLVFLCGGDDGNWWPITSYHAFWTPEIIRSLEASVKKANST